MGERARACRVVLPGDAEALDKLGVVDDHDELLGAHLHHTHTT